MRIEKVIMCTVLILSVSTAAMGLPLDRMGSYPVEGLGSPVAGADGAHSPAADTEEEADGVSVSGPRLHRVLGYATMAGAVATGLLGWLAPGEVHGAVAIGTTGLAAVTTGVGIAAYARRGSIPLGHVLLAGAGTLGFAANLLLAPEEPDSDNADIHRWLGTAATGAFVLSVVWVVAY
jgi:hypothetical protein